MPGTQRSFVKIWPGLVIYCFKDNCRPVTCMLTFFRVSCRILVFFYCTQFLQLLFLNDLFPQFVVLLTLTFYFFVSLKNLSCLK